MTIAATALQWPALDTAGNAGPATIAPERGVWGKVHGSPSDFGWIAMTRALAAPQRFLEYELPIGVEDAPARATLWRVLGDTCYAVACYPTFAHDAAGRSGFVEKQVLEWRRPADVPAAAAALMLLPAAASLESSDWRQARSDVQWSDDADDLAAVPPLPLSTAALDDAVSRGLHALSAVTTEEALVSLYASVLAGERAVTLRGMLAPLPPEAMAALLLPLPRAIADEVSIAGWLPSTRLGGSPAEEVRRCWNIVVGGTTSVPVEPTTAPTEEQLAQARAMAQSLIARRPSVEIATRTEAATRPSVKPFQLALWGPTAAGKTALLAKLFLDARDEQWDVFPTEQSLSFIQGMRARMKTGNQFPAATAVAQMERVEYIFRHKSSGVTASLQMEDRAGHESETLHEEPGQGRTSLRKRIGEADGLVLLFDPTTDQTILESRVSQSLELLYVSSGRTAGKDDRPIAVCISKADLLVENAADFRRAQESPDEFVRERVEPVLVTALDRYCSNYRLFPLSAAGVRMRHGIIEPVVFIDESLEPRICPGGTPFNLMAPFAWLLNQLTESP
ncbi:MAG TPA: hypothetical protein VF846_09225 [Thermoanaerobaculia bacterium]